MPRPFLFYEVITMAQYTKSGLPLMALEGGVVQLGSYVFDPDDADTIATVIEQSKAKRPQENVDKRTKKGSGNADIA